MTHCPDPRCNELLGAYALGACPPDEAELVREHLTSCPVCSGELAELSVVRTALLTSTPPREASAQLKQRVMAGVRADAQLFDAAASRPAAQDAARPGLLARLGERLRLPAPALGFAAALLIAVVVGATQLGGSGDSAAPARSVSAKVDPLQAPGGSAKLVIRDGSARLLVSGLPDPGSGRVYEVWLQRGTTITPTAALFSVDRHGAGEAAVPGNVDAIDHVLVTSEPAGGSQKPSRTPILAAEV